MTRPTADLTKWPHVSESTIIDAWPNWRLVTDWDLPINKLRQVLPEACQELAGMNLLANLPPLVQQAVIAFGNGKPFDAGDTSELIIEPERLTSLQDQATRTEVARSSIDVLAIFRLATSAIATGDLTGTPLTARDKIDLMKFLIQKAVPDAKSQEMQDVVQRVDRGRKRAQDFTAEDLKKLSRAELLDLVQ